jgi:hypothetical protein
MLDVRPWVEHEGRRLELHEVEPIANARRRRLARRPDTAETSTPFDPAGALLDRAAGRRREEDER